ncbi:hypothetical protein GCM10029964_056820 [Kibdelosporangium lantanae]
MAREEGGTPAIVESIRAGLVFAVKHAVGTDVIQAPEERLWRHALERWTANPDIEVLGNHHAARLSIVSFRIRSHGQYLHHNFVVAVLNDPFGIQARGGCSCAGPYGHRLLAIDPEHSHAYEHEVARGCDGIKPGWTRLNFNYFITDDVRDYLVGAVELIARYGHRLLPDYRFDPHTGRWRHHATKNIPVRLPDLRASATDIPEPDDASRTGARALASQLDEARRLLTSRQDTVDVGATGLAADFEALRWFVLPPGCLAG